MDKDYLVVGKWVAAASLLFRICFQKISIWQQCKLKLSFSHQGQRFAYFWLFSSDVTMPGWDVGALSWSPECYTRKSGRVGAPRYKEQRMYTSWSLQLEKNTPWRLCFPPQWPCHQLWHANNWKQLIPNNLISWAINTCFPLQKKNKKSYCKHCCMPIFKKVFSFILAEKKICSLKRCWVQKFSK